LISVPVTVEMKGKTGRFNSKLFRWASKRSSKGSNNEECPGREIFKRVALTPKLSAFFMSCSTASNAPETTVLLIEFKAAIDSTPGVPSINLDTHW
ncbi:hypothetical protein, partial [Pseudomonas viridiflava]|uniref:hypothetical protein n=1 Tax=Pseudomonas viridiflava TaxID=33069 RepID=UPI001981E021